MYICSESESLKDIVTENGLNELSFQCNNYREPCSRRGSNVTAVSVTGTGPGAVCNKPVEEIPVPVKLKKTCKINIVVSNGKSNYLFGSRLRNRVC